MASLISAMVIVAGCSSAKKVEATEYLCADSIYVQMEESRADVVAITGHSENVVSVVADSVKIYSVAHISSDTVKKKKRFVPLMDASLYGVKFNFSNTDSSSLLLASGARASELVQSSSMDCAKSEQLERQEQNSHSLRWGLVCFALLILGLFIATKIDKKGD